MGTTPIKDVMSLFPGSLGNESAGRTGNLPDQDMFAKAMTEAVGRNAAATGQTTDPDSIKQAPEAGKRLQKNEDPGVRRIEQGDSDTSKKTGERSLKKLDETTVEKAGELIDEKADEIADAIKEKLGITDEEFELVMAQLGLVPADLLNPDNIKELMLELSGEEDALSLITNGELLESINSVTDIVRQAVSDIAAELGVSEESLGDLVTQMHEQAAISGSEETVIPVNDMPKEDREEPAAELKEPEKEKGIRVEIRKNDDKAVTMTREVSSEHAQMDRKISDMMNERGNEEGMQNAMSSQNFNQEATGFNAELQPVEQMPEPYTDTESILTQITDRIKVDIGADSASLEMQLHPASLGTVNLQIASNNGVITAHLLVQNEAVKTALESQMVRLLETFEEQGQKVEAIEVSVAGYDLDRSLNREGSNDGQEERERGAGRIGRSSRRRLNLNELEEEDIEDLTEEEQLAAEIMTANGTSVDYMA